MSWRQVIHTVPVALRLTIVVVVVCSACHTPNNEQPRSAKLTFYPAGGIRTMQEFVNDTIQDGLYIRYYPNGATEMKIPYVQNVKNGLQINYYSNGNVDILIPSANGLEHGRAYWYYESGTLESEVLFRDGRKNGLGLVYYESGRLKAKISYDDFGTVVRRLDFEEDGTILKDSHL